MPSPVRLLAVDIDGTLLDSSGQLPDAHRQAVGQAESRGIAIVLATGRALHFAQPVATALGIPVALIVNNGAVARAPDGRTALRHLLARDAARQILAETRALEDSVAIVFDRADHRQIVYERMDWSHPNRRGYYEKNRAFIAEAPLAEALDEDPIQVMFNGSVEPMRRLVASLRAMPIADTFTVAITEYEARDFALVDINGPGCSKGSTLARWAAVCGIPREQVMAVGDNLNDLEMLEFAGWPVVMGNATDAMKARGFPTVPAHDEQGLAVAIRRFILGEAAGALIVQGAFDPKSAATSHRPSGCLSQVVRYWPRRSVTRPSASRRLPDPRADGHADVPADQHMGDRRFPGEPGPPGRKEGLPRLHDRVPSARFLGRPSVEGRLFRNEGGESLTAAVGHRLVELAIRLHDRRFRRLDARGLSGLRL